MRIYWNEAPDQATHLDTLADLWCKEGNFWHGGGWIRTDNLEDLGCSRYTPRPVDPWLPEVGEECEYTALRNDHKTSIEAGQWYHCKKIIAFHDGFVWTSDNGVRNLDNTIFRPLRTQSQIEREELIRIATQVLNHDDVITEMDAAEALYDAGMLKRSARHESSDK